MEFFGIASAGSKTGPVFPEMPESVLLSYPRSLLEHPAVPTMACNFLNIEAPDTRNILATMQTWADKSMNLLEKPAIHAVGLGLSASVVAYGAWRISKRWNSDLLAKSYESLGEIDKSMNKTVEDGAAEPNNNIEIAEKQLVDTRVKLDDLRYQLNRLEGEKDMLAAEVEMRKKMVAQLQGEINGERDKRRQTELKMEMMEWENTHLRRLRKEVAAKEGKIDILEASLKEKEAMHDKLFQENVIMPKSIAAARAREYETLTARVHKYEMNAAMKRNADGPYKPATCPSDGRTQKNWRTSPHIAPLRSEINSTDTVDSDGIQRSRLNSTSEWDNCPSSAGSTIPSLLFSTGVLTKAKTMVCSTMNWSNSARKIHTTRTHVEGWSSDGEVKEDYPRLGLNNTCGPNDLVVTEAQIREPVRQAYEQDATINHVVKRHRSRNHGHLTREKLECITHHEETSGVLHQIRSFFNGFSRSNSECEMTISNGTPTEMSNVLPCRSMFWGDNYDDKAGYSSHGLLETQRVEKEEVADLCSSVSEDRSSVFMSASCGSNTSDDDIDAQIMDKSIDRSCSCTRNVSSKNTKIANQLASPSKSKSRKQSRSPDKRLKSQGDYPKPADTTIYPKKKLRPESKSRVTSIDMSWNKSTYTETTSRHKSTDISASTLASELNHPQFPGRREPSACRARPRNRLRRSKTNILTPSTEKKNPNSNNAKGRSEEIKSHLIGHKRYQVSKDEEFSSSVDGNKPSTCGTDTESERSWIVIRSAT